MALEPFELIGGAGLLSVAILGIAAAFAIFSAAVLVLVRRSLAWLVLQAAALAAVLLAATRNAGGVSSLGEDAYAITLLCLAGTVIGTAPVAFARWVYRVHRGAERRLGLRR